MAALSRDLRIRLVEAVEAGGTSREVAERLAVSPSTVVKLMQRYRRTGSVEPAQIGGHRKPILASHEALIRDLVKARVGVTLAELAELAEAIAERGGPKVHLSTVWHMLRRLGLSYRRAFRTTRKLFEAGPPKRGEFPPRAPSASPAGRFASRRRCKPCQGWVGP